MGKLIEITTLDGLYLYGYYSPSADKHTAVLFVHGMAGNFYENHFIHTLLEACEKHDLGLLSGNNRGNGKDTDFNMTSGEIKRIGCRYELLEESHLDITAWITILLKEQYQKIVLIGHSAGTIKAVRYLHEGTYKDSISSLILLAPIDPLGYRIAQGRDNIEEYLENAQNKVNEGKGEELIPPEFDHDILSHQTFISWYQRNNFGRMFEFCALNYDFPVLHSITVPTKIIVGSKDEYFYPTNPKKPEEAMSILLTHIPHSSGKIIDGANHSFQLHEDEMVKEVVEFAKG